MKLTNRLTLFFLAALTTVLTLFSVTLYALARTHLFRQQNERATATLDVLMAAAEVEKDGLEWDLKGRKLFLRGEGDSLAWAVYDEAGRRVAGSPEPGPSLDSYAIPGQDMEQTRVSVNWNGERWRVIRRTLQFPHPHAVRSNTEPGQVRYRTLVFVTAWATTPIHATLRMLAWCLAGVSAAVWTVAALGSRWVCRRALAPVTSMSEAARQINTDDLGERLPVPVPQDELHTLATAFNDLLTRVQNSFERQKRFTGEASHQLRTPLTAMLGQLEVALRRDRDPAEYRRVLNSVSTQAGRLRSIVEMLLFLARADAETRLPDLETIDLRTWLPAHLGATWSTHARFNDLVYVQSDVAPTVAVQPALLGQAIDNLVDNAFKYSAAGSPVTVGLAQEGEDVVVVVEDRGPGIAEEDIPRVFTPFFRANEVRRQGIGGVGLGLAVTARIIRALGGKVNVTAVLGHGSRFSIRLAQTNDTCHRQSERPG